MLERRQLLVILAFIVATCSSVSRVMKSGEPDGVPWIEEKSLRVVMSWYTNKTDLINVMVVYWSESNLVYQYSSKFISTIHEKGKRTIVTNHRLVIDAGNGSNTPSQKGEIKVPGESDIPSENRWEEEVVILLVPDEKTFFDFLNANAAWHKKRLELTLIVVVPEENILCRKNSDGYKYWKTSVKNILRTIWLKKKILNVFLSAPSSPCIKDYLFSWNPFDARKIDAAGALQKLRVTSDDSIKVREAISKLFNTLENMNGYPLRASIFTRSPTVYVKGDHEQLSDLKKVENINFEKLSGLDSLVWKTVMSRMNCSVYFYSPSDNAEYGFQLENGTFVGMIGDLIYGRVDFAVNGVFLKDYQNASDIEFTVPVGWDSMCVVVPRADFIPSWLQTFLCFSPLVWNLIFLNIVICSLIRHVMQLATRRESNRRTLLVLFIDTSLLFVSSPRKLPRGLAERTLLTFWLLFGIIVTGTFQGTLYDSFTNPRRYRDINTLAELDESGLKIGTTSPNLKDIFGQDDASETLIHLRNKIEVSKYVGTSTIDRAASDRSIAAVERKNDLYLSLNTRFLDKQGNTVLHMIQECPRSYHLVYIVPTDAFYLRRINILLYRILESGLIAYWYNSTLDTLIMKHHFTAAKKVDGQEQAVAYSFVTVQTSFIILACGSLLSSIVFIVEKIRFHYRMKKQVTNATERFRNLTTT